MLEDLVRKVKDTQLAEKDPEAEQLLLEGLGRDPDAIYKLAQTVLVQNLALNQARAQLQQQAQQLQQAQQAPPPQPARATSFLGGLLHRDPAPPAPASAQQPPYQPVPYQQTPYQQAPPPSWQQAPPPQYAPPQYASAPPAYGAPPPSGAGSFLRSAATTAAGVAAGALAFEGIESLMHGHGPGFGGGGFGSGWGGGPGFGTGAPAEETVINNYYDDPNKSSGFAEHHEHEASFDDRAGSQAGLQDASYHPDSDTRAGSGFDRDTDSDTDTDTSTADSGSDSDSYDDSGSSDDSSSFDDSSDFGGGDDTSFV